MQATTTADNTLSEMTSAGLLDAARSLLALAPDLSDAGLARCLEVFDGSYRAMARFSKSLGRMPLKERIEADRLSEARKAAERAIVLTLARRPGRSAWAGATRLVLDRHGDLLILDPSRLDPTAESRRFYENREALYPAPAAREAVAS